MDILMLILTEIILGYLLQSVTCLIWLYSFSNNKINSKSIIIYSSIITAVIYGFRHLQDIVPKLEITFGLHILLYVVIIILIGIWKLKMNLYKTVIVGLSTAVLITLCELIVVMFMSFIYSPETIESIKTMDTYVKFIPGDIGSIIYFGIVLIVFFTTRKKRLNRIEGR